MRRLLLISAALLLALVAWLALAPVPVTPVAWEAPPDPGHTGVFASDSLLAGLELVPLGGFSGPESVARDAHGRVYVSTREGAILRLDSAAAAGSAVPAAPTVWARTGGRPLGLAFGADGTLYVADGARGILALDTLGTVTVLADSADGTPLMLTDDIAVATDGRVYASDASTKFGAWARAHATEDASLLDIVEHGGHGRLVEWDPATRRARIVRDGLQFANGIAMLPGDSAVLLAETGRYRVVRIAVQGPGRGTLVPVLEALPGFPDNITRDDDGTYWLALFAPRNALLDRLSGSPALRRALLRIPRAVRPRAQAYGHIVHLDASGRVLDDRQDPTGRYPKTTDVQPVGEWLYVGALDGPVVARVRR